MLQLFGGEHTVQRTLNCKALIHGFVSYRMLASTIFDVVYGIQITGLDDARVQTVEAAMAIANEYRVPGATWVDVAPFLRIIPAWVPGARFKKLAARCRPLAERTRNQGFDFAKSDMVCCLMPLPSCAEHCLTGFSRLYCWRYHQTAR